MTDEVRVSINYSLFPEWEKYRVGEIDPAIEYANKTFETYIRTHWKKRIAKKILKRQTPRRGRIFREYWNICLDMIAFKMAKEFLAAVEQTEKLATLPKVTVELVENPPTNNPV